MKTDNHSAQLAPVVRWARNGFVIGLAVAIVDVLFPWRDAAYHSWSNSEAITANVSQMLGSGLGGALIGVALAAVLRRKRV